MPDDPKAAKILFVQVPDQEVLLLLRDFLEPLGYRVEFAKDVKRQQALLDSIKSAAGALLLTTLDIITLGTEICSQLEGA